MVQRQRTAEVADKRKMFDLITSIENRAKKNSDSETLQDAEQALALWTCMLAAEQDKEDRYEACVQEMQVECDEYLEELVSVLDKMDHAPPLVQHVMPAIVPATPVLAKSQDFTLKDGMELRELIGFCESVAAELRQGVSQDVSTFHSSPSGRVGSRTKHSKTTVSNIPIPNF
jgi:hypothetical protein